jgi:serine/threonine-protein kinase
VERLGKYEIISEIGRGAMGSVYKARDPLIGRLVALKTITSGLSGQANSLERFYQEARSAGALQHPNIITIYELGHENNTPFIAMEYIEGGSLDHLIEQHQVLPLSVKLGYIVHVCEALSYAHSHNVIHRDVKPANIMVTKEGVVKVVDFGIARLADLSLTQPNMMIGSRAYMSPQLYKGERADARSDIWAVGVTLYELLANRRPFTGDSEAELMFRIMTDNPPPLQSLAPECPPELADIIAKTLEKKAEDRYQSMEEVTRDLEPIWRSAQQATVAGLLADCQQLIAANDLQRAQGLLRKALQIDTTNTQAKSLMEKVTAELRRNEILPKVNEHLERGRSFLQTGKLREARAEVEAALGLDSRHETAQRLRAELEAAVARAQEVEQKLRLTKQRLAEGALTEAAAALGRALEIDGSNPQAQELRHQIEEEKARREKRKKLSEILHHARTLWTALNYEECLQVLAEGLREFPHEPELIKLQEMARHDLEDLRKQRHLGEVRKLLGQQEFAQARKIIDELAVEYRQDSAVKSLQMLVLDGEREEEKAKRLVEEMAGLRALLSGGRFADAVAKGDALLLEYPEEFELKELVDYARGEAAQQEQRRSEKVWEQQILELIQRENYTEAEAKAKRAAQELPKVELFQELAEDARQKRELQEQSERARRELKQRIEEIHGKLQQEKIGDAISLAAQTLVTFGPDPNVTQLLGKAAAKQEEQKKKELQERELAEARTMAEAGNYAGATQVLNQAMATQIFERSDPRVQQRLREIEQLSSAVRIKTLVDEKPPGQSGEAMPAIEVKKSAATKPRAISSPLPQPMFSESEIAGAGTGVAGAAPDVVQRKVSPQAPRPQANAAVPMPASGKPRLPEQIGAGFRLSKALAWLQKAWQSLVPRVAQVLRKPIALGAVGVVVAILVVVILVVANRATLRKEQGLRTQALQQWSAHELDESEATWRQMEGLRGSYQKEAAQQIQDIESKRQQESQRFQEGESLLNDQKEYARAAQAFQDVVQMNLWLAEKARAELERATASGGAQQTSNEEQLHFDQGKTFFEGKAYDQARKEFQAALDLNVPNSQLRPQIDSYLKRIAQGADAKKLYEQALADIKNENWESARSQLQELADRKGAMSGEVKQRLADVTAVQKAEESFRQSLQAGAYSNAKNRLDGMQKWPKTQDRLLKELRDTEISQATSFKNRASTLQANNDLNGLDRLQTEFHQFAGQVEEPSLVAWAPDFDKWLIREQQALREKQGDKATFEAAVADFNATKEKGDLQRMDHEVLQKFQKIAKGSGAFRAEAQEYVDKTIPAARRQMAPSLGKGKMVVPPIMCSGGQAGAAVAGAGKQGTSCSQMDAGVSLQWIGVPTVEFPASANQPGKLPYVLRLLVFVDASGKVKIEKNGDVDNDFFKKAKDASKNWRTTIPQVGGKPAKVSFPLEIKFEH